MSKFERQVAEPGQFEFWRQKYPHLGVLFNLVDQEGNSTLARILKHLEQNPQLRRIVIIGLPGSGKTTIALQLAEFLHLEKPNFSYQHFNFDLFRKYFIALYGETSNWTTDIWLELNHLMSTRILQRDSIAEKYQQLMAQIDPEGERQQSISIIQVPIPGKRDRGTTLVKGLRTEGDDKTLVIAVVSTQNFRARSSQVRNDVLATEHGVQQMLRDKYNIELTHSPQELLEDERIRDIFRAMAPEFFIHAIGQEFETLVAEYIASVDSMAELELRLTQMQMLLPFLEDAENYEQVLGVIYYHWFLTHELGYDEESAIVTLNIATNDTVFYPITELAQNIQPK